jgi:hypothetical protein
MRGGLVHGRRLLSVTGLTAHPLMRFWARALALALVVHVGLPDYDEPGWGGPRALKLTAAAILLFRPHALGFALGLGTSLYTLLALRDVLTQQVLLACMSGAGLVAALAGTRSSARAALQVVTVATAATYALAALHKLNTDFFDPTVSCAQHAWAQVEAFWFAWAGLPGPPGPWLAVAIVLVEGVFAALLLAGSPWIWPLGIAFHLPLTVTLAPAFGAVMLAGYAAGMGPRTVVRWRRALRRRGGLLVLAAAIAVALDLAAHGGIGPWDGRVKVAAGGALVTWAVLAGLRRERLRFGRAALVFGVFYTLHGLLPYTGLKVQHAGAMLSNLRVDPTCHNSAVFPPSMLLRDPYVYVDEASIGHGQRPARERVLRETLWSIAALHAARENWCIPELRPIVLKGRWRGEPFEIPDLCAADFVDALPDAGLPGPTFFPWYQALQKNLPRTCHAACVH